MPDAPKILITADAVGGIWTYARELVCGLVRRGVEVTLVSFGHMPEPRQLAWTEGLRNLDFRPTAFRLEWMQDSLRERIEDLALPSASWFGAKALMWAIENQLAGKPGLYAWSGGALDLCDRTDPITELVARKIIEIGQTGVRDPLQISKLAVTDLSAAP